MPACQSVKRRPFKHFEAVPRWRRHETGASAVEFAIVAPPLFMVILGILVYGLYFGVVHSVQQLAADTARASVAGLTDAERSAIAEAHLANSAPNYLLLDAARMTMQSGPAPADGNLFVVTVTYDASDLGVLGLTALLPVPSRIVERSAVARRGGF